MTVREGEWLWEASTEVKSRSNMRRYMEWLGTQRGLSFPEGYQDLWEWSVRDIEAFWCSVWDYFEVRASQPFTAILGDPAMPGARWFEGSQLNFAEHILDGGERSGTAIIFKAEGEQPREVSWDLLRASVASVAKHLRSLGVRPGDCVASYMPNIPETVVAFLATASVGAVWANCSPDLGAPAVIERIGQLAPKVLFAADGYRYAGRVHDRRAAVGAIRREVPSIESTIVVCYLGLGTVPGASHAWARVAGDESDLDFEQVPFAHPLWVLYTSGTTGAPKGIVHGHGGALLGWLAALGLHMDARPSDRVLWYTQTGWIVWNLLVANLLLGATIVLYDGSPSHPQIDGLWDVVEETGATFLGTSASYLEACAKAGARPSSTHDLSALRAVAYTASPLVPSYWGWIYARVKPDVWLFSASGGTEICGPLVGGTILRPVLAGEFQCACLGVKLEAYDDAGNPVIDEIGELVLTEPLPSMPVFLWGDDGDVRYRSQYYSRFPGVWAHGDAIRVLPDGRAVIYGRSDSTINRLGVRFGTGEVYRVLESLPEIADSLMVDATRRGGESHVPLFLVLSPGVALDADLRERILETIRSRLSPRHVPDDIVEVPGIPRTLTGKRLEVPVRRVLLGEPLERVADPESLANPESLQAFARIAGSCSSDVSTRA